MRINISKRFKFFKVYLTELRLKDDFDYDLQSKLGDFYSYRFSPVRDLHLGLSAHKKIKIVDGLYSFFIFPHQGVVAQLLSFPCS